MPGRLFAAGLLAVALLSACAANGEIEEPPGSDPAGVEACSRFRAVSADAFAEALSVDEVESGLRQVGSLAADSTTPAIRESGVRVGDEVNAEALINGESDLALDALADACNSAHPL